ncbi:Rhs family protein [Janthinobacterium sp. CG23_2]|nr:Rhs family protein [Janthinobacterium sp. CG23_2]CUU33636.1 Rhs family protein [Janthinobacterium sp. CG23_2]
MFLICSQNKYMYRKFLFAINAMLLFSFSIWANAQDSLPQPGDLPAEDFYLMKSGYASAFLNNRFRHFKTAQEVCTAFTANELNKETSPFEYYNPVVVLIPGEVGGKVGDCGVTTRLKNSNPSLISSELWRDIWGKEKSCPDGYSRISEDVCRCADATLCPKDPPPCECDGNPIYRGSGIKKQSEIDYESKGPGGLRFERNYDSKLKDIFFGPPSSVTALGFGWRHTYSRRIEVVTKFFRNGNTNVTLSVAYVIRPNSRITFREEGGNWKADPDVNESLIKTGTGWEIASSNNGSREFYNARGMLTSIVDYAGLIQKMEYSNTATPKDISAYEDMLISVTDHFGNQLKFTYDANAKLRTMTDPSGAIYHYDYDSVSLPLGSITYPDLMRRKYLYDEPEFSQNSEHYSLTGIVDENNVRYATYRYQNDKAILTEHAGGVNKYSMEYSALQTNVTDPLGTVRTYVFAPVAGAIKEIKQTQPGGSAESQSTTTYDGNGNIESNTDFKGMVTRYSYDMKRNLERSRTEAYGIVGQQRTTTTTWHSNLRLPMQIFEPLRVTSFSYDTPGRVLTKTEQPTLDIDGSKGANAVLTGSARKWTYTYYPNGQLWSVKGPRSDVADVTTYTYDEKGNLFTIKNAVGHVTTMQDYDANGRVGTIIEPNKVITTMTYWPRGWLKTRTVTAAGLAQATAYDYDGVGQLKLVTRPDASTVAYTYDDAHRLIRIADSLGNNIVYTLDNMGNRTKTEVKDPNGLLGRQGTRVIDVLNRLQQSTGAQQ